MPRTKKGMEKLYSVKNLDLAFFFFLEKDPNAEVHKTRKSWQWWGYQFEPTGNFEPWECRK